MRLSHLLRLVTAAGLIATSSAALAADLRVPEDFSTIKQAVKAASAGDTVLIAEGEYAERFVVRTPGVALVGDDAVITRRVRIRASRVEIRGLTFRGRGARLDARGNELVIEQNSFEGGRGLRVVGDSSSVSDNTATSLRRRARFSVSGDDATVRGNTVFGEPGRMRNRARRVGGIYFGNAGFDYPLTVGITVLGDDAVVDGNVVRFADTGFVISGSAPTVRQCVVDDVATGFEIVGNGCRIESNEVGSTRRPVYEIGAGGFIVRGGGFDLRGLSHTVVDNSVVSTEQHGFTASGSGHTIEGNEVLNSGWAAFDVDGDDNAVIDNEVGASDQAGFRTVGERNRLELNLVTHSEYAGFEVTGTQSVVRSNHVEFAENDSYLIDGDQSVIVANTSARALYAGFDITGSNVTVEDNTSESARYSGFEIEGDTNGIVGNTTMSAGYFGFRVIGNGNALTGNAPGAFGRDYSDYSLTGLGNVVQ